MKLDISAWAYSLSNTIYLWDSLNDDKVGLLGNHREK